MAVTGQLSKGTKLQRQFAGAASTTTTGFQLLGTTNLIFVAEAALTIGSIVDVAGSPSTRARITDKPSSTLAIMSRPHNVLITSATPIDIWGYQDVLNVTSVTAPSPSSDQVDVTSHNDTTNYREMLPGGGLLETGELQVTCSYDPADDDATSFNDLNALIAGIQDDLVNDVHIPWRVAFPPSHTDFTEFEAKVTGVSVSSPIDGVHTVDLTMKVYGDITWPS